MIKNEVASTDDQIARAYKFFERKVRASQIPDLEKLKQIIVSQLILVSIVLDRDDNPHLVFESLNAKGRAFSSRPDPKLLLHEDSRGRARAFVWRCWTPMQDRLGENLTECIRHFLMKDGGVIKQGEIYFALKERADEKSPQQIIEYLQEITGFAEYYARLLTPSLEPSASISHQMHRLNRIEVTTAYPFLLNIYNDYTAGKVSEVEFAEILRILENFMVRRFVCGVPSYGLNKVSRRCTPK